MIYSKQPRGHIFNAKRKIINKNYFAGIDSFNALPEILNNFDGYEKVYKYDSSEYPGYINIFADRFGENNFPNYFGPEKFIRLEFLARWNKIPVCEGQDKYVEKPEPDINSYQRYIYESDAQNFRNEYFRTYYRTSDTTIAYITDVKVYKVSPAEYVFAT